jgi:L-asparaginase
MLPGIELAIDRGLVVIMVSRCASGGLLRATYATRGSEIHLRQLGVIHADALNGQKARMKLVVVLSATRDPMAIRQAFEGQA